jgi:hypothetical protein
MSTIEEQQQLMLMRGMIVSLPEEQQGQIKEVAARLREIIADNKEIGLIALSVVGAELSVQP